MYKLKVFIFILFVFYKEENLRNYDIKVLFKYIVRYLIMYIKSEFFLREYLVRISLVECKVVFFIMMRF